MKNLQKSGFLLVLVELTLEHECWIICAGRPPLSWVLGGRTVMLKLSGFFCNGLLGSFEKLWAIAVLGFQVLSMDGHRMYGGR